MKNENETERKERKKDERTERKRNMRIEPVKEPYFVLFH